jgi:hypothetical protein
MTSTSAKANGQAPAFECSKTKTNHEGACGKVKLVMEPLDAFVTEQLFFVLDTPEIQRAAADEASEQEEEEGLRQTIADAEEALTRLADEKDDGLIEDGEYRRRRARITARRDEAKQALLTATRSAVHAHLPTGDELRTLWAEKDNVWRRTIAAAAIERIDVMPHPRGVTSAPPRRRGEPETAWRARFDMHRAETLAQRVTITWWD